MDLNIDSAIFIGFLLTTIIIGLASSRGIKTIKEYAIGDRNFSTVTITATLVATWVSGNLIFSILPEIYNHGLYFIWAILGGAMCILWVGIFFAPRLGEFIGKLSIAEAMGELYGNHVRIITVIAGCVGTGGIIAVQLKISGILFEYCFGIKPIYGIMIGSIIITLYSALGGIKSVTFTDVIQLFTFGTIIPTIAFFIISTIDSMDILINILTTHELFDYKKVFDFTETKSLHFLLFFIFMSIPGFNPAIFQRIAMAKNTTQIARSFTIAAFVCAFITIIVAWIGVVLLAIKPGLNPNQIVTHILFDYSVVGLKGLALAGIMAMVMSTADSYINSTSILLVNDFCKPLGINTTKNELIFTRIISVGVGCFALFLSLSNESLMNIIVSTNVFYLPIVTVPFILTTLGFRSSSKSVLIGMGAGFTMLMVYKILQVDSVKSVIPSMLANLIFLIGSHYFLKQPGGWVGIKDEMPLLLAKKKRKIRIQNFIKSVLNFNLNTFLSNNDLKSESMYTYVGIFCLISTFTTMHAVPRGIHPDYCRLIDFIYPSVLFMSTILISYPLWLNNWKETNIISVFWNLSAFYILICVGFALTIMSNFAPLQLMGLMASLILIAVLMKWQWAVTMIVSGLILTVQFFKFYLNVNDLPTDFAIAKVEAGYLLLLVSSILIIFLKPKQEHHELTEEKNDHLNGRIKLQEQQVKEALAIKGEFIRNISHEYHAPMTGISTLAEILKDSYYKLNDAARLSAINDILKSSVRLEVFDANISSLSKLSKADYQLNLEKMVFSELVYERIELCRKLYEENKEDREFILNIEGGVTISGDKKYLIQLLDNLIINAIAYCKKGKITITLRQNETGIEFIISDEGIGIPSDELYEIFAEFTVSSKTHSFAGGRGVGLALAKRVVEVHNGTIKAESDGIKGARFNVTLPL